MKKLLVALMLLPSILFAQERVNDGIMSMYWFYTGSGNVVQDVAISSVPIHLTIQDPTNVTWLPEGGLVINSPTSIKSSIAPWWIATIESVNEFSVEMWVEPANYTQSGPARIAAYSLNSNPGGGNFIVGQTGTGTEARVRTSVSDAYGKPGVTSSIGSGLVHIVATRSTAKVTTIYLNGTQVASSADSGVIANWGDYYFALANDVSGDRPWLGTLYFFGLFDRALTEGEVAQNYSFGHLPDGLPEPPPDYPVDSQYTWTAPTTGSEVDHYIVQSRTSRNPTWIPYALTTNNAVVFGGLAGVTQWIRVAGIDADGRQGVFSEESLPYTPDFPPTDVPSQPGKPYRVK
jgi:hypothetical protein